MEAENALEDEDREAVEECVDNGTFRCDRRPNRRKMLENLTSMLERYRMAIFI